MNSPPENANAPLAKGRRGTLIPVLRPYHALTASQVETAWSVWCQEGRRLWALFWSTDDPRHLIAFGVHVRAMRRIEKIGRRS